MTHPLIIPTPPSYRRKCEKCGEIYTYYPDDPEPCRMCEKVKHPAPLRKSPGAAPEAHNRLADRVGA